MSARTDNRSSARSVALARSLSRWLGSLALVVALAAATGSAAAASAAPALCRYVEAAPAGPGGNYLVIEGNAGVGLRRAGEAIEVIADHGAGRELDCEGQAATVHSIDRILYRPSGGSHQLVVDESGGRLAPGATPEPGGDEIEIYARFPKARGETHPELRVLATPGPDQLRIGRLGRQRTGIDLDVAADGAHPDADVIARSVSAAHYTLDGGASADRIGSSGRGPELDGPLLEGSDFLVGGPGEDLIAGGPGNDVVRAGPGADRIFTRGGEDAIDPGTGFDRVHAGEGEDYISTRGEREEGGFDLYSGEGGDDSIEAIDGERELVLCGPGLDHVGVDELDEWSSPECEKAHGPGASSGKARRQVASLKP